MQYKIYGVIEVGSYAASLRIYEISKKSNVHIIDTIRYPLELGKDVYNTGKIGPEMVEKLCSILSSFVEILNNYQVDDYCAFGTSALREAENNSLILSLIKLRTNLNIRIYSNSEVRFIGYKAIASIEKDFDEIIQKGTAIIDVGGGSIQLSLFDKDNLISTQNIRFGNLRIRERLSNFSSDVVGYENLVEEMILSQADAYSKMFLKDRKVPHIIFTGDFISEILGHSHNSGLKNVMTREEYLDYEKWVVSQTVSDLEEALELSSDDASLLGPTAILFKVLADTFGGEKIWIPGMHLADGFAYDYGVKQHLIPQKHNFENDIIMAARNIGKRYGISKKHVDNMDMLAQSIFNSTRKVTGLTRRDAVLLKLAVHLHDCGRYINLARVGECSYNIIMNTEIIGVSHKERTIIALTVLFNTNELESYSDVREFADISVEDYVLISKLTAILKLVNALDRTHQQKITDIKSSLQDNKLILRLTTKKDYTLEGGLLENKLDFFTEIFQIKPDIRIKKL